MTDSGSGVVSLNEYTAVLRRWFRLIVGVVALGAIAGTLLLAVQPSRYTTEALVQIRPIVSQSDDPNLDTSRQIEPATEVAVANSQRVAEWALALRMAAEQQASADTSEVDFTTPEIAELASTMSVDVDEVRSAMTRLSIRAISDSQILAFRAEAADAEAAQALAQSSAVAYLEFRNQAATAGTADSRDRLAAREEELVAELDDLAASLRFGGDNESLTYADIAKRQELTVIGTKFANLEALTVDPGVVLTDARLPASSDGLPILAGPIMGAALALVAALTAVFLLDRTDDRLRSGRVELSALGVPMLGSAPVGRVASGPGVGADSKLYPVNTSGGDAYRRLHGTLLFNLDSESKSVVLVAGVKNAPAATSVAANVAATAARAGRRTLIIGADLRNAKLGSHLGRSEAEPGLSDVIIDGHRLGGSIHEIEGLDQLSFLGAGTRLDQPADVLQSAAFARLMAAVQADFDLVVVEAPPILRVADAVDAVGLCDGAIVVAERGSDSRQAIAESVEQLRSIGSDIVGVVVAEGS
jgi:capsular exopolysaccharide synthesis family protein